MDQSRSSNEGAQARVIPVPKRSLTVEFWVGIFTMLGVAAAGYLAVGLADLEIMGGDHYQVFAEFDNISGLKQGASVEIAGVPVGQVTAINLDDPQALVTLRLHSGVKLYDDDILAIRTKGIIGDRYVKISRGGAGEPIAPGGRIIETESVVDLEDVIGKIVHSLTSDDSPAAEAPPALGGSSAVAVE
jgi:phospholipid/cholesterol/gamma-HCH transport system substrate-binding protein